MVWDYSPAWCVSPGSRSVGQLPGHRKRRWMRMLSPVHPLAHDGVAHVQDASSLLSITFSERHSGGSKSLLILNVVVWQRRLAITTMKIWNPKRSLLNPNHVSPVILIPCVKLPLYLFTCSLVIYQKTIRQIYALLAFSWAAACYWVSPCTSSSYSLGSNS